MTTSRIAIIGAGVGGLSCAWALHRSGLDVTVYERGAEAGGHARTVVIEHDGERTTVDVGVQAICPGIYPNVTAMARLLGVRMIPFRFGYTATNPELGVCGVHHQDGAFWREVEPEVVRFVGEMYDLMALNSVEVISCSIGEYLASRGYSPAFSQLISALGATVGQEADRELDTSVLIFAMAVTSGLMSLVADSGTAVRFVGGVRSFITALSASFASRIKVGCGVTRVERLADGVRIHDVRGAVADYDQVVFAVDGATALAMLADPSPLEDNLLSSAQLQVYDAVVHSDTSVLIAGVAPSERTYIELKDDVVTDNYSLMNLDLRPTSDLFMTYSGKVPIDPSKVYWREHFDQGKDNTYSFEIKRALHRIQGRNHTWFASGWTTAANFETAAVSGLIIARALGAEYPFATDPRAAKSFEIFEGLMLRGQENFSLAGL